MSKEYNALSSQAIQNLRDKALNVSTKLNDIKKQLGDNITNTDRMKESHVIIPQKKDTSRQR